MNFYPSFEIFIYFFIYYYFFLLFIYLFIFFFFCLIICFEALVCKFGNKNVFLTHLSGMFSINFSNFQYVQKMVIFITMFLKTSLRNVFGLITHIIKLFQTVHIQKGRFKIC